ncbi:GYF domain-containing protein [Pseudomonas sp. PLMAX]|uniref:GYF domain-containing protein n=1 Tax=Pseudomonas sp. PLMAX TaxID=2201998 RepID=UPI0038B8A8D4
MSAWWYVTKDKKKGPVEVSELKKLIQAGTIGVKTMVWREGMDAWQHIDEVDELRSLLAVIPPPFPSKQAVNDLDYPMTNRWARFFARIFDVWWETLLVVMVSAFFLSRYSAPFVGWINSTGASQMYGIICMPFALILDAILYRVLGNTPGKALLGIKVRTVDGKRLGFMDYFVRNLFVWVKGFALGLPLINLVTMSVQSSRLGKGQEASYDEASGYTVRSKSPNWIRKIAFGLAFICLFGFMAALNQVEKNAEREKRLISAQKDYSWENPKTLRSIKIDSRWKLTTQPGKSGVSTYVFTEAVGYAVVVLAMEEFPGYSLSEYAQAFQKGTAANMSFSDGGRIFERDGRQFWEASGTMISSENARVNVQVSQFGAAFWRVAAVQSIPYDYSNAMVDKLKASLWSTLK